MSIIYRVLMSLACIVAVIACQRSNPANEAKADAIPSSRWASVAQLPDWSGAWAGGPRLSVVDFGFLEKNGGRFNLDDDSSVGRVPLNAKYKKLLAANIAQNGGSGLSGTRLAKCLPAGMTGIMDHGTAFEFLFTPGRVTMLIEDGEVRRIFTDGRLHPATEDLWPTLTGDSIGNWEGQTLVVHTIAMSSFATPPITGSVYLVPLSTRAVITERIRIVNGQLEDQMTITDPLAFTHPLTRTIHYKRVVDTNRVIYDDCTENDRDPVVDGKYQTIVR